ncbi:MAG: hypothetical protein PF482_04250 [Desulfobacteraceae bacterium]|jgi:hypothetical protein|nr:hypothetical protein [Desulfobacteraceae bacterium]
MKDIFKDVMGIEDVHGLMVVSNEGSVMLSKFSPDFRQEEEKLSQINWVPFIIELGTIKDAELLYDNARFYIKKSETEFLIVIIGENAPISMVRLNCEILLPLLTKIQPASKRIGRILRRKIF